MAITLSELTTLRDALIRARSSGVREVRDQNGESIQYKSDAEMSAAIHNLNRQIAGFSKPPVTDIRFTASKGLD